MMKCNLKKSMFLNRSEKFYKSKGIPLGALMEEYFEKSPFLATSEALIPMVLNGHKSKFKKMFDFSMNLATGTSFEKESNKKINNNDSLDVFLAYLMTYNELSNYTTSNKQIYCKFPFIRREISPIFLDSNDLSYQQRLIDEIYAVFKIALSDCKSPLFSTTINLFNRSSIIFNTIGFLHYIGLFDSLIKSFENLDNNDYTCDIFDIFTSDSYKAKILGYSEGSNNNYEKIDENFDMIEYFNDIDYNERLGFLRVNDDILNKFKDSLLSRLDSNFVAEKTIGGIYSIPKSKQSSANLVIWSTTENKPHIMMNGDVIQYGEKMSNFTLDDLDLIQNELNVEMINAPFYPIQIPGVNCVITKRKIHQLNFRSKDYFNLLCKSISEFYEEFDKISIYAFSYDYEKELFDSDKNFIQPVNDSDKSLFSVIDFKVIKEQYDRRNEDEDEDDDDEYDFNAAGYILNFLEFELERIVIQFEIEYKNKNYANHIVFNNDVNSGHIAKVFSPDMFHFESDATYTSGGVIYDNRYNCKTGLFDLSIDNFINEFNTIKITRELTNVYESHRYCLNVESSGRFVDTNLNGVCNTDLKLYNFGELMIKKIIFGMLIQNEFELMNLNLYQSSYGISKYFRNINYTTVGQIFSDHYKDLNANRIKQLKSPHISDMYAYLKESTNSIFVYHNAVKADRWERIASKYDYKHSLYNYENNSNMIRTLHAQIGNEDSFDCKLNDVIKFICRQYNKNNKDNANSIFDYFKDSHKSMSKMLEQFDGSFESILGIIVILEQVSNSNINSLEFRNNISNEAFEKFIEIEKIAIDIDFVELCKKYDLTIFNPKEANKYFNEILIDAIMLINAAIYSFVYVGNNPDLYYTLRPKSGDNSIIREFKYLMIEPEINFKGQI